MVAGVLPTPALVQQQRQGLATGSGYSPVSTGPLFEVCIEIKLSSAWYFYLSKYAHSVETRLNEFQGQWYE